MHLGFLDSKFLKKEETPPERRCTGYFKKLLDVCNEITLKYAYLQGH